MIIAGSREVPAGLGLSLVEAAVLGSGWADQLTEVVSGTARGIDKYGEHFAVGRYPIKRFPADWDRHGKAAGAIRNRKMAQYADALILVWDGVSPGSRHMLQVATELGLQVYVYKFSRK